MVESRRCKCGKPGLRVECLDIVRWIPCVECTDKAGEEWEKWRKKSEIEGRARRQALAQATAPPDESAPQRRPRPE